MKWAPLSSSHSWISGCVLSWPMSQHWVPCHTTRDSFIWSRQFHRHQEGYINLHTLPYHDCDHFAAMPHTDQGLGTKNPFDTKTHYSWWMLVLVFSPCSLGSNEHQRGPVQQIINGSTLQTRTSAGSSLWKMQRETHRLNLLQALRFTCLLQTESLRHMV